MSYPVDVGAALRARSSRRDQPSELRRWLARLADVADQQAVEVDRLRAINMQSIRTEVRLRGALRQYGGHRAGCGYTRDETGRLVTSGPCDCGWDDLGLDGTGE